MPIEIKELHIKINVNENGHSTDSENSASGKKNRIVAECVEQVMEILSKKEER